MQNIKSLRQEIVRLENKQRLIREETLELQKYLLDGVNPGHLRVSSTMDALMRVRQLCMQHAELSEKISWIKNRGTQPAVPDIRPVPMAC